MKCAHTSTFYFLLISLREAVTESPEVHELPLRARLASDRPEVVMMVWVGVTMG